MGVYCFGADAAMATGWISGTVTAVPSGDSLVISGKAAPVRLGPQPSAGGRPRAHSLHAEKKGQPRSAAAAPPQRASRAPGRAALICRAERALRLRQGAAAPSKVVTLSSLIAPRLGRRGGENATRDEPFAWAAREQLRKKCIGQANP